VTLLFNSAQFAIFLPVVWLLYWRLRPRPQLVLLLVASYIFYGAWDYRFLALLIFSTVVDYTVGRGLARTDDERQRRLLLTLSLGTQLAILGFFKYFDFFIESAQETLDAIGLGTDPALLQIILPVGISFYTFQTMSYTIDVYRRHLEPSNDLLTFAVFVAYFPQLVAGPIERATRLLPQLERPRIRPDTDTMASGLSLILLGLVKKVVIGDVLATKVDEVFDGASTFGWVALVVGIYAFALQIYADFSGYTDIARGASRLMGIELMRNFEEPYLSRSITEFWRRWHISLSQWLRDYLYIPLGGNQRGTLTTYRNLMITMLLGGLWHGANWVFVIWGGLHGVYLCAERLFRRTDLTNAPLRWRHVPAIVLTFQLVCFAWIFFRSPDLSTAMDMIEGIFTLRPGEVRPDTVVLVLFFAAIIVTIDVAQRLTGSQVPWMRWRPLPVGVAAGTAAALVVVASGAAQVPFIYFQF
jgi:D-alanyl-lipoteichoic acid acyltransferase DltB (MBOAT superfamily)